MKTCPRCEQELDSSRFHKDSRRPDGLFYICKKCRKPQVRRDYEQNKQKIKERARQRRVPTRKSRQLFVYDYLKSNPCVDCGEDDIIVLEFDHVKGVKRDGVMSLASNCHSEQVILEEIEKCEVVCANCHKRRTYGRMNSLRCQ